MTCSTESIAQKSISASFYSNSRKLSTFTPGSSSNHGIMPIWACALVPGLIWLPKK
jgi:hypothetical protein